MLLSSVSSPHSSVFTYSFPAGYGPVYGPRLPTNDQETFDVIQNEKKGFVVSLTPICVLTFPKSSSFHHSFTSTVRPSPVDFMGGLFYFLLV